MPQIGDDGGGFVTRRYTSLSFKNMGGSVMQLYTMITVEDAIFVLKGYPASEEKSSAPIDISVPDMPISEYAKEMRDSEQLHNHIVTASTPEAIKRFKQYAMISLKNYVQTF